jgi:hypothetical protein
MSGDCTPKGVEYEVRDKEGNLLEIATNDGQRIYVSQGPLPDPLDVLTEHPRGHRFTHRRTATGALRGARIDRDPECGD